MKKFLIFTLISLSQFSFCGELARNFKIGTSRKEVDNNYNKVKNCKEFGFGFCKVAALGLYVYIMYYAKCRCSDYCVLTNL